MRTTGTMGTIPIVLGPLFVVAGGMTCSTVGQALSGANGGRTARGAVDG